MHQSFLKLDVKFTQRLLVHFKRVCSSVFMLFRSVSSHFVSSSTVYVTNEDAMTQDIFMTCSDNKKHHRHHQSSPANHYLATCFSGGMKTLLCLCVSKQPKGFQQNEDLF